VKRMKTPFSSNAYQKFWKSQWPSTFAVYRQYREFF
jgi:hypothetical protein